MTHPWRRIWVLAALAGALALAAGACTTADPGVVEVSGPSSTDGDETGGANDDGGGSGGVGSGLGDVAQEATASFLASSAQRTAGLDTGTLTMSMTVAGNPTLGPGEVTVFSVEGAFDVPADSSRFVIDMSGMLELDPSMLGDDPDTSAGPGMEAAFEEMMLSVFAEPVEMIQIGDVAYLHLAGFGAFFGTDKEWFSSAAEGESLTDSFEGLAPGDLATTLGPLENAGEVTEVGREEVGGVETTHYTVEVDTSAATGDAGGAAGALLGELGSLGATLDVWIDDDGLIRQIRAVGDAADFDGEDLAPGLDEGTITFVLSFEGLGEPVDIEPPPADEVFDLDAAPGSGLGSGDGFDPDELGRDDDIGSNGGIGTDDTFITTTTVLGGGDTNRGDAWER